MYSKELLKGTLTTIILKLLKHNKKMYGYEIVQRVKILSDDRILLKEGSLYPALHKLKEDGLVDIVKESVDNRVRKYYFLTEKGKASTEEKINELNQFMETLQQILVIKPQST